MKQTGKQLAGRIDRSYYQHLDPYVRFKRNAGLIGLSIGVLYSCWAFTGWGSPQISSGDLSHAHAAWNESGCENCHLPNTPIRPDAWGGRNTKNVALNNEQCNTKCHSVTSHFANRTNPKTLEQESCTECHREHLGKAFQLVDLADQSCSRCHEKLDRFVSASVQNHDGKAYSFSKHDGHPEFRVLKQTDPGTIQFSHIQHLRPGQPKSLGDETSKLFRNVEAKFREQYSHNHAIDLSQLIQLRCDDCHEPDVPMTGFETLSFESGADGKTNLPTNEHRLYKPVRFDKHCVACHDLDGISHGLNREQMASAVEKLIPLRQLEFLKQRGVDQTNLSEKNVDLDDLAERELRLRQLLNDKSRCSKCHELASHTSTQIVEASQIPRQWFTNANFPHGAHLHFACKMCHPAAFETSNGKIDSTIESNQVMIEGIESCRVCHIQDAHNRAKEFANGTAQVATADCVDCHRYHVDPPTTQNRDRPYTSARIDREEVRDFLTRGLPR